MRTCSASSWKGPLSPPIFEGLNPASMCQRVLFRLSRCFVCVSQNAKATSATHKPPIKKEPVHTSLSLDCPLPARGQARRALKSRIIGTTTSEQPSVRCQDQRKCTVALKRSPAGASSWTRCLPQAMGSILVDFQPLWQCEGGDESMT